MQKEALYQNSFDIENAYCVLRDKENLGFLSFNEKEDSLLEKIVEKKVYLELEVKVEKDWRKKQNILKNFGYQQED